MVPSIYRYILIFEAGESPVEIVLARPVQKHSRYIQCGTLRCVPISVVYSIHSFFDRFFSEIQTLFKSIII
jgi:hypothetical protein